MYHILFAAVPNLKAVTFQVPVATLAAILGLFAPIATGLLTKSNASPLAKAVLNAGLGALLGLLAVTLKNDGWIDLWHYAFYVGAAMVSAWASYAGLTKHVMARTNYLGTANVGLGGSKIPRSNQPRML